MPELLITTKPYTLMCDPDHISAFVYWPDRNKVVVFERGEYYAETIGNNNHELLYLQRMAKEHKYVQVADNTWVNPNHVSDLAPLRHRSDVYRLSVGWPGRYLYITNDAAANLIEVLNVNAANQTKPVRARKPSAKS